MIKSSDKFKNGCIPMHCSVQTVIYFSEVLFLRSFKGNVWRLAEQDEKNGY